MDNPLLSIQFPIPFDTITAEHVEPAVSQLLKDAQATLDRIAADESEPTYDNTLHALESSTEKLELAMNLVGHLEGVATTEALRNAYNAVLPEVTAFYSGIPLYGALYNRLVAFSETDEAKALTGPKARLLKKTLADFRRHGAELDEAGKKRLAALDVALSKATTQFSQQVLDATNAWSLTVEDEAQLAGLPDSAKAGARQAAEQKGEKGFRFTLHAPSLIPVLTYLDDRGIREKVWRAYQARACGASEAEVPGELNNRPLIRQILKLRREKARLLGFKDFSDLVLEDRMAKSGGEAFAFVQALEEKTRRFFEDENQALVDFLDYIDADCVDDLAPWDLGYYGEKLRKAQFDFDEEVLRPYFPVDGVLKGLFETARQLYDVTVTPDASLPVWNKDVTAYALHEGGKCIGRFYVDLFPREDKRGGAWMMPILSQAPPGEQIGLFAANVNPAVGDKPALLTHSEVSTLFHEFGHLLHHLLNAVEIRSLAGTNVAWDFVELPSQILENWCWEREALDLFAHHYETGECIPEELFDKMMKARTFRAASAQMRQLSFATVDLRLHRDFDAESSGDPLAFARNEMARFSAVPLPDPYGFICAFSHIFGSPVGYAAGYYSYKWAEVLDADAFSRFKKDGIFNRETGTAFRENVLSKGDSDDPMALYEAFMGRKPELNPLLERQGLTA